MRANRKLVQWLVLVLGTCLSFTIMASVLAAPDFLFAEPEFETLFDAESIDNKAITALAQDARGLIWIGTQSGLVRYDGYRFRRFAHKVGDPFSLADDFVMVLLVANDGRIWVGTRNAGISVFDPASERFQNFRHDQSKPDTLSGDTIFGLASDAQGGMWIATNYGLDHLPISGRGIHHFRHSTDPHSLLDNRVRGLLLDKAGTLWVGSNSGLQRLAPDQKNFETVMEGRSVANLFQAQDGKLWLGSHEHGAAWLMPASAPGDVVPQLHWLHLVQLSHLWIDGIAQVGADQIWLTSNGGGIVVVAASDGQVLQILRHDRELPGSLKFDQIKPLLLDRAGWLWVGTWGEGLQRTNANNTMLRMIRHSVKRPNGLSHPDVRSVLGLADGRLAFGTKGNGIDIFDRQRGLIGGYRTDPGQSGALPDAFILTMAQTADGSIWAGTHQAGVVRQFPGTSNWVPVAGFPEKQVNKFLVTRDGSLWAGTGRGVARWQAVTPSSKAASRAANPMRFEVLTDEQGKPIEAPVFSLAEDDQGQVWIGTQNGLWLHEAHGHSLIRVSTEPNRKGELVFDAVGGLLFDSRGNLWASTNKGLGRLKSRNGKLIRFEDVSALFGQAGKPFGRNLLEDRQGRIWTGDEVIDWGAMRMSQLSPADGIKLGSPWVGSYGQTRDGWLFYGDSDGVAVIDPARFKPYDYNPPLVVSELKINGESVPAGALVSPAAQVATNGVTSLTLDSAQRNFAIEFAALDYSEPKKNRYQYRLQGYDKAWINTDSDHRSAAYGNLWPGSYMLQVRGSNRLGEWSTHELSIPIRVLPAWWQTWWFGLVLLLLLSSLLAALVQVRTRYLRQRQHELEQLVEARTGELRQKQAELVNANHELNDANADLALSVETLRQLGDIGREITANLDADIVFRALYLYVGGLLDAPTMTIYRMNAATRTLDAVFGRDDDQVLVMRNIAIDSPTSSVAQAVRERQELLFHYDSQDDSNHIPGTRQMLTALFAPLIVDAKVLGVMSIQSDKQNAWGERERLIFRNLTAYGAIALANAAAVAALRQAQGQLVQQEKMASLGGLVAGIAHEINTPLGTTLMAISGAEGAWQTLQDAVASGRLSKSVLDSSTVEGMEYTALALKTATRAAELIALFKTISVNADSDRVVEIELADYLPEVATLLHTQLVQNGSKLEVTVPASLRMQVVPDALTEALSRILVNVLNHAFTDGRTGTLRISAQVSAADGGDDEVVLTISDNGHGIAPEDLPKVFDPFFTTKSGIQGHVGLGLHVAYNHVTQRLKGQIHITSTLGEGTCVEIRLKK